MTRPRGWPNNARDSRERAIEESQKVVRLLMPIVQGEQFDRTETLRRLALAMVSALSALRALESVSPDSEE